MKHDYKYYCKDYTNIENYEKAKADNFKNWDCHHRKEAEFSRKELIALGIYYNVSSEELIFLTRAEHNRLHKKDKRHTDETRRKISATLKGKHTGKDNPFYGKKHSEETKLKISEANKGKHHSIESRRKMSEAQKGKNIWAKGRHWYNNGIKNIMSKECPDGFVPGRLLLTL